MFNAFRACIKTTDTIMISTNKDDWAHRPWR